MPGFLGGGSSSGSSGELKFSKEFIDPVTKLRVSEPENLIDTDFEYGLQPTKWETVELINNTPSFFSKSGDTTIDGIISITTNSGTREITVETALEHGLAVGIPIQVTGTKSITADGSYIINSIPNANTFTYLCKDNQIGTNSIEDLYSSIITGEFFQGSQLRISDDAGVVTDGEAVSTLTVTTDSTHGFGVNTPFYFLNLNSTISQEFQSSNTATKSFDASNSATAQTFDGSNTLSSVSIDLSNSAVVGGITSSIATTNPANDTITVTHGTENFSGKVLGTPLYYDVVAGSGFFAANPRGVVFLKTIDGLGTIISAFQVSEVPDGPVIDITGSMTGTFQLANQARVFAGNNVNPLTQQTITVINDPVIEFDATNTAGGTGTVVGYSGSNITIQSATVLDWYTGAMVFYSAVEEAATNLTNNTTYFVDFFTRQGSTDFYSVTLKPLPNGAILSGLSGGVGTQTLKQIGVSLDRNIFHVKNNGYAVNDMLRYDFPVAGHFGTDQVKNFYWVQTRYDQHNFSLTHTLGEVSPLTQSRVGTNAGTAITPTEMTFVGFESPYNWAVTSGTLPAGLTLNATTGVISGTPSAAYTQANVEITITDASGSQGRQIITFQFNPRPNLYDFTAVTFTPGGASGRSGPNITQARNGIGNPSWASTYLQMPQVNGYMVWTVPETATYRITSVGAAGWSGSSYRRSYGALVRGDFALTQGDQLTIAIGQAANASYDGCGCGAGGGGTFVTLGSNKDTSTPMVIAGGAGGGGNYNGVVGIDATSYNPTNGDGTQLSNTGYATNSWRGNGGAGFYGNPASVGASYSYVSEMARHFRSDLVGGYYYNYNSAAFGGFGGGGPAHQCCEPGGGGGYTGGSPDWGGARRGGAGGSFNNGANASFTGAQGTGDGYVTIQKL